MKICLTGGSGFLGTRLSEFFFDNGYVVENISRSDLNKGVGAIAQKIEGSEMLVNLAGASIMKRWTSKYKKEIYNSRINTTKQLVEAFVQVKSKPEIVLSASAVGIYDTYDVHDEFSDHYADDFLAGVCKDWEAAITPLANENIRFAVMRLGVVLDQFDGALSKMLPSFRMGVGATIGDGYQAFPFIHINDFLSAVWYVLKNPESKGVYNLVAPELVSNRELAKGIGKRLKRPVFLHLPERLLRLMFGDGADVLTKGQKVVPQRLLDLGYPFQFPTLDMALDDLLLGD